jgi:hypothetical protein
MDEMDGDELMTLINVGMWDGIRTMSRKNIKIWE